MFYRAFGIIILFLSTITLIEVNCQLTADAGHDTIYCASNLDEISIGGNPTASGGTPPYSYTWSAIYEGISRIYTASWMLEDTTVSNPIFKEGSVPDSVVLYLTVKDANDSIATDSVEVRLSSFILCLGECRESINEGDSVQLHHCIDGGIPPYTYNWTPTESLSNPTILSPWASPTTTTTYELTLTDSAGCETQNSCHVSVTPKEQDEPVLVREGRLWSNTELGTEHGHPYHSYYIKFEGDTIINDTTYKVIWRSDDELHLTWYRYGAIREDSTKKIYTYNTHYHAGEQLLYDFGLQKGDSILSPHDPFPLYVCDINYITFEQSTDTFKQIKLTGWSDCSRPDIRWIEGIGSPLGVLIGLPEYLICCVELNLVCYYENETLKYQNSYFSTCFPQAFPEGIDERVDESYGITVYPNPFTDQLTIDGLPTDILLIEIYDLFGRLVYLDTKLTASSITINTVDIKPGLYLIRVRATESGQMITSRVIVKK